MKTLVMSILNFIRPHVIAFYCGLKENNSPFVIHFEETALTIEVTICIWGSTNNYVSFEQNVATKIDPIG